MSTVQFTLNGQSVEAPAGKSIFNIAKELGIAIPHLCHKEGLAPDGNCRACVVEVDGERTLAPSCCRSATPGMKVQTNSERAVKSQKMVLEMLLADLPEQGQRIHAELVGPLRILAKQHRTNHFFVNREHASRRCKPARKTQEPAPNLVALRILHRKNLWPAPEHFLPFCACFLKHRSHAAKNFRSHG